MWILCDVLDEDHSSHLYYWLLGLGMKMFKLYTIIFKFHMMMTNNTILPFKLFSNPESLDSNTIEEIRIEWARYFITNWNNKS